MLWMAKTRDLLLRLQEKDGEMELAVLVGDKEVIAGMFSSVTRAVRAVAAGTTGCHLIDDLPSRPGDLSAWVQVPGFRKDL